MSSTKIFILFTISLWGLNSWASTDKLILKVCSQFNQPSLKNLEIFTSEYMESARFKAVKKKIIEIKSQHGDCRNSQIVVNRKKFNSKDVYFEFQSGYRLGYRIYKNKNKILEMSFGMAYPKQGEILEREAYIPMKDGVKLITFVFRSANAPSKAPVILVRTPYLFDYGHLDRMLNSITAKYFTDRGYHLVIQGIRGRLGSEGEYKLFHPIEIEDARTTLDWIDTQDFSNGVVGAMGTSYEGFTALATGITNHPSLKLVVAGGAPTRLSTDAWTINGISGIGLLDYLRYNVLNTGPKADLSILQLFIKKGGFSELDPSRFDELLYSKPIKEWKKIAAAFQNPNAKIWKERNIKDRLPEIKIPTFHVAGTDPINIDADSHDVLSNFKVVDTQNNPNRLKHHLIMGYWSHGASTPVYDGSLLSPLMNDQIEKVLSTHLKPDQASPKFRLPRVIWEDQFRQLQTSNSYPNPNWKAEKWYLRGGGKLSKTPSVKGEKYEIQYSPQEPLIQFPDPTKELQGKQWTSFRFTEKQGRKFSGEIQAQFFVRSDAPVADLIALPMKVNIIGVAKPIASCLLGGRFYSKKSVVRVETHDCPVSFHLRKGEEFVLLIASQLPGLIRVRERNKDGDIVFKSRKIEILNSTEFPSHLKVFNSGLVKD